MPPRPPVLYRVSRLLLTLSVVAMVVILVYLAVAAYSVSQVRIGSGKTELSAAGQGSSVSVTAGINLTNGGYLPVSDITLSTVVRFPTGEFIARGESPALTIGAMSQSTVPVTLTIPLNASSSNHLVSLLTQSLNLPATVWVNATFASIAQVHAQATDNISWGAPFSGLNVTLGSPALQGNGTVAFTVTVSYSNQAPFHELGTIQFGAAPKNGASCVSGTLPVDVPQNGAYYRALTVYAPTSCNPSGGTIALSFTGAGLSVTFPSEPIP